MSKHSDGGPAFPYGKKTIRVDTYGGNETEEMDGMQEGMTLRDYFAAKAMQAAISDPERVNNVDSVHREGITKVMARMAYQMADAMMEAREE